MRKDILLTSLSSLTPQREGNGQTYEYLRYEVASAEEFDQCLVNFYEIPPGKCNYPYHYHTQNTEVFYILSGEGILETPDGEKTVRTGDVVVFPPGKNSAHRLYNPSQTQPLVYLDVDTSRSPDIPHYPETGKTGISLRGEPGMYFQDDAQVGYFDGEK